MEETKNTENFEEVLDENEESKIEEPAKESKFKKAVSKAKDKIKDVKVTTVLKAVAVGAGLVAAYTLGSRHVEDEDGAVAENDYVELEDLSGDSGESKETKMEETKNTENFEEVLDENEESKIEEPAKESKFKKAVSKAKDKIKDVKVTTVLKAVAVGAGLVAAYTLGSRHVEDEDGAVAENDYVELEDLSGDSGESKETEE